MWFEFMNHGFELNREANRQGVVERADDLEVAMKWKNS